jgi:hypothetical protein
MKHIPLKMSVALAVCCALACPLLAGAAEDTKPPLAVNAPAAANSASGQIGSDTRKFSQAGHSAMMNIGDARLAIFNGDTKTALKLMESAKTFLVQAEKDSPAKLQSVPVDGQLALADDFMMTPEKKAHVDKANESFKKGDQATGLAELHQGAIDVNYTRWWLPMAPTETHLDKAISLANDSKYYEANLALKAIEDSVTVDSISLIDLPTNKKAAKTTS